MSEMQEEPKSKEEELQQLQKDVQKMRGLLQHEGWVFLKYIFAGSIVRLMEEILNNATRLEMKGKVLDGMQAIQIEAMEKGQLKGLKAVLNFPELYIAQAQEQVDLLKKTIAMKQEQEDGTRSEE